MRGCAGLLSWRGAGWGSGADSGDSDINDGSGVAHEATARIGHRTDSVYPDGLARSTGGAPAGRGAKVLGAHCRRDAKRDRGAAVW